jgi:hypothetical protein
VNENANELSCKLHFCSCECWMEDDMRMKSMVSSPRKMLTKEGTTSYLCCNIIFGLKTLLGHSRTKRNSAGYGSAFVQIHSSLEFMSVSLN